MKLFFALSILFLATLMSCSNQDAKQSNKVNTAQKSNQSIPGQKTFLRNCKVCHGRNGGLGFGGAAKLTKSTLSEQEALLVITKGRNKMQPFEGILSEKEIQEVASYIQTLKK